MVWDGEILKHFQEFFASEGGVLVYVVLVSKCDTCTNDFPGIQNTDSKIIPLSRNIEV